MKNPSTALQVTLSSSTAVPKRNYPSRLTLNGPENGPSVHDLKVERGTPVQICNKPHACGRALQRPLITSVVKFRGAVELCEVRRR